MTDAQLTAELRAIRTAAERQTLGETFLETLHDTVSVLWNTGIALGSIALVIAVFAAAIFYF
jgi:hypothetical protein